MSYLHPLSSLDIQKAEQGWGPVRANISVTGSPLRIGSKGFTSGWGTHAPSELIVDVAGKALRFRAKVGVDDNAGGAGSITFRVIGDDKVLFESPKMKLGDPAVPVDVALTGVQTLVLRVDEGDDGNGNDHANWADAWIESPTKPTTLEVLPGREGKVNPGKRWLDSDGKIIQAHSGGILVHQGRVYWFGEDRTFGYHNKTGVAAYSSTDLITWRNEGIVMPKTAFPVVFQDEGVCERPKVIFNRRTGKFVMWSHLDYDSYRNSRAGVAVSDSIAGPYVHVKDYQPFPGNTFRDMNLFVDDDGTAYVLYASEDNATLHIVQLTADYLSHVEPAVEGKTWARAFVGSYREAPAPFKYKDRYYLITSGCTGWAPNPAQVAVADNILGPWKVLGNPAIGRGASTTYRSQSTFVFSPPGAKEGAFIYMGDRWNAEDLANSRYIWLPFVVEDSDQVKIRWRDSWDPAEIMAQ